jgi:predicted metalloprotease with PDZ domain
MIEYHIRPLAPEAHEFEVQLTLAAPAPQGQTFALPAWIPGSYLIRDFARHLSRVDARCGNRPVACVKLDKQTWRCAPVTGALQLTYRIYAWDLSVRGACLDTTRGYFNGAAVFLRAIGREHEPCRLHIALPAAGPLAHWHIATSLQAAGGAPPADNAYLADSYWDLIDHPVELGNFTLAGFSVRGIPHQIAISGARNPDLGTIVRDLAPICEQHAQLFGVLPIDRYLFLVQAAGEGYGGLEHRFSTSLLCRRQDLRRGTEPQPAPDYRRFLALCSHEYLHLWHVTRIRPQALTDHHLESEAYTRLLWWFEGVTAYYDELALVRSGVISPENYLESLAREITRLLRTPGRWHQTLEEASFDAWIKFYKPDENSPNVNVSYYNKGALVALLLDLEIRRRSAGAASLDRVMRLLWERFGHGDRGVAEDAVAGVIAAATGLDLSPLLEQWLRGTEELPLGNSLAEFGIRCQLRPARNRDDTGGLISGASTTLPPPALGVRFTTREQQVELSHVLEGGAAQQAGLAAGDTLVALDGLRIRPEDFEQRLTQYEPGARIDLQVFRRDLLLAFSVTLQAPPDDTCDLGLATDIEPSVLARRTAWLRGTPGA